MGIFFIVRKYVPPAPPEPESSTFLSLSVADDGVCLYNSNFGNTGTTLHLGWDYPCNYFCFYPTIPQGSTINSCYVTFISGVAQYTFTVDLYMRFINEDNANQSVAGSGASKTEFQSYAKTSAIVWPTADRPNIKTDGLTRITPELKTILQTVISREGWVSGNRLIFYLGGPAANIYAQDLDGDMVFRTYDYGGASRPQLYVN